MADYLSLSEKELREYIKSHPDDEDAFQYYLSIVRSQREEAERNRQEFIARTNAMQEESQQNFERNQAETRRILQSLQVILDRLTDRRKPDA